MALDQPMSRRRALATGAAGVGALVLAGCGSDAEPSGRSTAAATPTPSSPAASPTAAGNQAIAKLADVPVGGAVAGKAADGSALIVAQPSQGQVVAFSARCTHRGCVVAPAGKVLDCPCHGSRFDAFTGAVLTGPAARPLPKVDVRVENGQVVSGSS